MADRKRTKRRPDPVDYTPRRLPESEARPCPFCGWQPTIQGWHGGGPRKRRVDCANEDCAVAPSVAASTRAAALREWNRRTPVVAYG